MRRRFEFRAVHLVLMAFVLVAGCAGRDEPYSQAAPKTAHQRNAPAPADAAVDLCYQMDASWGPNASVPGGVIGGQGTGILLGTCHGTPRLYVATGDHHINAYDLAGGFVTQWGGFGDGPGQLYLPIQMSQDAHGNIFVADAGHQQVQVFDCEGGLLGVIRPAFTGNPQPQGAYYDNHSHILYVSYTHSHFVQRISVTVTAGNVTWTLLDPWTGFNEPQTIVADAAGFLYVVDTADQVVKKLDHAGQVLLQWSVPDVTSSNEFSQPLATDGTNLYVLSGYGPPPWAPVASRVDKFDDQGNALGRIALPAEGWNDYPYALAADARGGLYLASNLNAVSGMNMVARFVPCRPTPPPACPACSLDPGQDAAVAVGQPDFVSMDNAPVSAASLNAPEGLFQADNVLVVADRDNNRILCYTPAPGASGVSATRVIGQASFTASAANRGGTASSQTLAGPYGVWTDGATLIAADTGNNRVLIYRNLGGLPPTNAAASVVIGQASFANSAANRGGSPTAATLSGPRGVFYDGRRLFIADTGNNRVLVYNGLPFFNGASASEVIGQASFTGSDANAGDGVSARSLSGPQGLWVSSGSLYVADTNNNRVLVYNNAGAGIDSLAPGSTGLAADAVAGQANFLSNVRNNVMAETANPFGLAEPGSVSVRDCQLFVSDPQNQRVLVFSSLPPAGVVSYGAASVLGQMDLRSSGSNRGQPLPAADTLNPDPSGLSAVQAVDGAVYVADTFNNRVLIYRCTNPTPPAGCQIRVQYRDADPNPSSNSPHPQLRLYNDGPASVSLSTLGLRYWFTEEGSQAQSAVVDYAGRLPPGVPITGAVTAAIVPSGLGGQTHDLLITFGEAAGSLLPGQYAEVQARFNKADWSPYDQSNDYSFDRGRTSFADFTRVAGYCGGGTVLAWGQEP